MWRRKLSICRSRRVAPEETSPANPNLIQIHKKSCFAECASHLALPCLAVLANTHTQELNVNKLKIITTFMSASLLYKADF